MKTPWLAARNTPGYAGCIALLLLFLAATSGTGAVLAPVSASTQTNRAGAAGSFLPSLSADGRVVAFVSHARNLVGQDDRAPWLDVFVRDLESRTTVLASKSLTGTCGGNADSADLALASNGRFVAFASAASNLVPGDTNRATDVFLCDLASGTTTLVSVDAAGGTPMPPNPRFNAPLSGRPQISTDGRWVVFESRATNLLAVADSNGQTDLFARDLATGTTHLVSVASGTAAGNGASHSARLTPDGRVVAFVSTATNLVPGVTNRAGEIFVRNLLTGRTLWVSSNAPAHVPPAAAYACFHPVISADGQTVVFKMSVASETGVRVLHHDLATGISRLVTEESWVESWPQVSGDGRVVACEHGEQVQLWDRDSGETEWASVALDGTNVASAQAHTPVLSADGQTVAFLSRATNLVDGATNGMGQIYVRDRRRQTTELASRTCAGLSGLASLDTALPSLSQDGQWIAFSSPDDTLVEQDRNGTSDVFVRNLVAGDLLLVSERDLSRAPMTGIAFSEAAATALSADGSRIGFVSFDGNLASGDTNGWPDAFVWDRVPGKVIPVSVETNNVFNPDRALARNLGLSADGTAAVFSWQVNSYPPYYEPDITGPGNLYWRNLASPAPLAASVDVAGALLKVQCYDPMISRDGRAVAFNVAELVNRLVAGGSGGGSSTANVFVRDMFAGTNGLVSVDRFGSGPVGYGSTNVAFSPDGQWLLFSSSANNLTTNNILTVHSLFARNLVQQTTVLVSVGPERDDTWGYAEGACFSGDSQRVAYVAPNRRLTIRDLHEWAGVLVSTNACAPSLDYSGRLVAYEFAVPNGPTDILVADLTTWQSQLVSRGLAGVGGNGDSTCPSVTGNGRYIVYASRADNLVPNDRNQASDIFVQDRLLGVTLLASANHAGTGPGNGPSDRPTMAANGRTVVFQSFASDLVVGDYNLRRDVFVLDLGGLDGDGDGLDDDWELAYFETLARDGRGDFDLDLASDAAEFRAGTDPTDRGSVLRVLTLTAPATAANTILWSAVPGRTYRVEYRDGLGDAGGWRLVADAVTAVGPTGTAIDPEGATAPERFYRVVLP